MNAVEIEEAISELAIADFDPVEFPFQFLAAFGNNEVTLKRLRKVGSGGTNFSDLPGAVLQRNHIHLAVCEPGRVRETLAALKVSPKNLSNKVKLVMATDGDTLEAEYLDTEEPLSCSVSELAERFGFFLPFAGITTIQEIKENPIDVRATGRLNKLYVELLANNKEWDTEERRSDMNHFMARLIFCFFAEDTGIFDGDGQFTRTVDKMTEPDGSNTHDVLKTLFDAMNLPASDRVAAKLPVSAQVFPYVNGGLFSGNTDVPRFTRAARSYLLRAGELNWRQINPDIFGSMIQAVADKNERGSLGMHYTSVPNILRVLNPLFLDDLRGQLEAAGGNKAKLLNLRKRMARIRVFDPACGSGNFLVIAYKEMRKIEAEINRLRGEEDRKSDIPINNFRGIELNDFPAEIARLALIIAEFQSDVLYRGRQQALATVLPLDSKNWILCGNALQVDWLSVCPPDGVGVKLQGSDLFSGIEEKPEVDFMNEGGETYICGNPPYYGSRKQEDQQKQDMKSVCGDFIKKWKSLDYVAGWFLLAKRYMESAEAACAFVATSSICEGLQVGVLWPHVLKDGVAIRFGVRPFKWSNLAAKNAGVTVVVVGIANKEGAGGLLYTDETVRQVEEVSPYLTAGKTTFVDAAPSPIFDLPRMVTGSMPRDGGGLILSRSEADDLLHKHPEAAKYVRPYVGSDELINGGDRSCLWIDDSELNGARKIPSIEKRLLDVERFRNESPLDSTREYASKPHRFVYLAGQSRVQTLVIGAVSSERREYLPVGLLGRNTVVSNLALAIYDSPLWCLSLIASKLHLAWIAAVCGKLETRYRYSNTLGWNTFPIPILTDQNKLDLTRCAKEILLAREASYPRTIAELYDPDDMPDDLRRAHERNDEVVERIYIGRRFRNDTERLEKLFDLYTKMTAVSVKQAKPRKGARAK